MFALASAYVSDKHDGYVGSKHKSTTISAAYSSSSVPKNVCHDVNLEVQGRN